VPRAQHTYRLAVILTLAFGLAAVVGAGCESGVGTEHTTMAAVPPTPNSTSTSGVVTTTAASATSQLEPLVTPTLPATIPGYAEVDPATGLHMTGTPQVIDPATYRLRIEGKVTKELSLSYDDLRRLPRVTATPTLNCPDTFVDIATWSGVPRGTILTMAGMEAEATKIRMDAADGYSFVLSLEDALRPENFLAYEWEGQPLPVLHGFPLRAVIPGKAGAAWVKWLVLIVVE
jgi:DMSO/TMAO reductase YedYZ molybdopterin-dependent catalytic subunit